MRQLSVKNMDSSFKQGIDNPSFKADEGCLKRNSPYKMVADESDGVKKSPYKKFKGEANTELEPVLIRNNQDKIAHFRRFGIFLVYWKDGKYKACQKKLLLSYLLWYSAVGGCFGVAYGFKELFKEVDYENKINDLLEASFVAIVLGTIPAFWIYLLREYNINLPQILNITKRLEKHQIYKELEFSISSKVSYKEGWLEDDHNDSEDEGQEETKEAIKEQLRLVKYGPYIGFTLSISICVFLIIAKFVGKISELIFEKPASSLKHLKKELPFFIMTVLYPIPYFLSIWFCVFFLEWQRKIHESVRYLIRNIKKKIAENIISETGLKKEHVNKLNDIGEMMNIVQKVFILLNKRIFQKTIVIDFVIFIFLEIFCTWKVLQDPSNFCYAIPFLLIIGHIYFVCSWSSTLMKEFTETNEVLNEIKEEYVESLRNELNKCPPQVMAFGGFSVNYSMMTAVLAFILSCIGIPEEMWPEETQYCYKYDNGEGFGNLTLCLRKRLLINVNRTLSLKNLED